MSIESRIAARPGMARSLRWSTPWQGSRDNAGNPLHARRLDDARSQWLHQRGRQERLGHQPSHDRRRIGPDRGEVRHRRFHRDRVRDRRRAVGRPELVISEKGVVKANVHTVDAVIMGTYEGTMIATGEVEIASTGRVSGHIETDSLVIAKGGAFTGNVTKSGGGESKPVYLLDDKRMNSMANHVGAER